MCVAFVTVSATFGNSPVRGLTSLFVGLALGLVGIDTLTGQARLTFGVPELLDGIEVTTLAVGSLRGRRSALHRLAPGQHPTRSSSRCAARSG